MPALRAQEQLEQLLDEAQSGGITNGEGPSADEKVSAAPGPGDGRQSPDREQPLQSNSNQNGDISGDFRSETQHADDSPSSDVDMSDVEPQTSGKSVSAGPTGARARGLDDSTNDKQLLVDFQQMSISEHRHSKKKRHEDPQPGDIEAFGGQSNNRFFIFRVGPIKAPKYVYRRTNAYSTKGLKNISFANNRISKLRYEAENGDQHWQYTKDNIVGVRGIAIDETGNSLRSPHTWIKIEWMDIKKEHQALLGEECNWTTRSDVIRLMGPKLASLVIHAAWDAQETLHLEAINSEGKSAHRALTPCPLAMFEDKKIKRERSDSPHRYESSSVLLKPLSSAPKSHSSISGTNPVTGIKQEPEEEPRSPIEDPPAPNATQNESSGGSQNKKKAPQKFNIYTYMANVEKLEKWNTFTKDEREEKYRRALAHYDHYKEERLLMGDEEAEEEL
ncbi:uncharacterized protein N7506_000007 [Penicillium brevicompactum]|uniref:uncharacterized protein n=1 Tax=Penicillium brevicompactum TaxID=5074 RepID=UPI002541E1AD|nr:uncharacterized protein N7506_000007 [Penicillium brevicompactum]KAJ5346754.1 hypothetical protein N7506_000007 [Penicillium brevicompactum]